MGKEGSERGKESPENGNVKVVVRVRPITQKELEALETPVIEADENRNELNVSMSAKRASQCKSYPFDNVFGPTTTQQHLFETVCRPVVDEVLQGYNCTIFAYGQTGTGKTFTMEGLSKSKKAIHFNAGIIPRSIKAIFEYLNKNSEDYTVQVSHLELYNEALSDLLSPNDKDQNLKIYEETSKGTYVSSLTDVIVEKEEDIFSILEMSSKRRKTAETLMNKTSSRSHSIFTITIHLQDKTSEGGESMLRVGKLNLVDLAGAENISRSGAVGVRSREAGNINQSLLTLGRVISALVANHPHIPYRDSKLTRILQESLGGRNKTLVIATCSPAGADLEETNSTIEYAYRAKKIRNRPQVNLMVSKKDKILELVKDNSRLRKELESMRTKEGVYLPADQYNVLASREQKQLYLENLVNETNDMYEKALASLEKAEEDKILAEERSEDARKQFDDLQRLVDGFREEANQQRTIAAERRREEEVLREYIDSLKDKLEKTTADHNSLCDTVNHKLLMETENCALTKTLESDTYTHLAKLKMEVKTIAEKQAGDSVKASEEMDRFTTAHTKGVQSMSSELRSLWDSVAECIEGSKLQMKSFADDTEAKRLTVQKQVGLNRVGAENGMDAFVEEVGARLLRLGDLLQGSADSVVNFRNASESRRDSEMLGLSTSLSRAVGQLNSLETVVRSEVEKQQNILGLLESELEETIATKSKQAELLKETVTSKLKTALTMITSSVQQSTAMSSERMEQALEEIGSSSGAEISAVRTKLGELDQNTAESVQTALKSIDAQDEQTRAIHTSMTTGLEAAIGEVFSLCTKTGRNLGEVESETGKALDLVATDRKQTGDLLGSVRSHTNKQMSSIAGKISSYRDTIEASSKETMNNHQRSGQGLADLTEEMRRNCSQSTTALKDCSNHIVNAEGSLQESYRSYQPTSSTPRRR
mmetsp:Transcript_11723/g.48718  ORF Transcript_11723/g.48718 Transcript_11723/m.48718 type:complete len:937 (-) Transcript_11723:1622-4432(-)